MTRNKKAKNTMLPHSEAKVDFYKKYLATYLRVLYNSEYIDKIMLFDVFCGTGIYENGKAGSPIIALQQISELKIKYPTNKTSIELIINDTDDAKTESIVEYHSNSNKQQINLHVRNSQAQDLLVSIGNYLDTQKPKTRNLIFIDPYGYKEIKKEILEKLLANGRSEIILFLPISNLQRFTQKALDSDEPAYKPLRNFVESFFEDGHVIKSERVSAEDYIDYLNIALRFDKFYSASYYIERDASNKYALFFITNNLYGLEKVLEVKWSSDKDEGRGWKRPSTQQNLFALEDAVKTEERNYKKLKNIILDSLKTGRKTNNHLYELTLINNFQIKHLVAVLKTLRKEETIFVNFAEESVSEIINKQFTYRLHRNNGVTLTIAKS